MASVSSKEDDPTMNKAMKDAKESQVAKDFILKKRIVEEVLVRDGPERVLLAGEAGIGKTRLAKMVADYAVANERCFMTIWVHLNKKFVDELSLYQNIASQLCVYSDFEETEVDDRDEEEDEEKNDKDLLLDLQNKIKAEIKSKGEAADDKELKDRQAKDEAKKKNQPAANEAKKLAAADEAKKQAPADEVAMKNQPVVVKPTVRNPLEQYLLLILDDGGIKVTDEVYKDEDPTEDKDKEKDTSAANVEDKDTSAANVEDKDSSDDKDKDKDPSDDKDKDKDPSDDKDKDKDKDKAISVPGVTSEERVMKDLNLRKFLTEHSFLKNKSRLKILVTERTEVEKPAKSEEGNNGNNNDDDGNASEGNNNDDIESETEGNNNEGNNDVMSEDSNIDGNPDPQQTSSTQPLTPTGPTAPLTDEVTKPEAVDESGVFDEIIKDDNLKELLMSLITDDWKFDDKLISDMVEKSKNSPAAIVVLAKSLNQSFQKLSSEITIEVVKETIRKVLTADRGGSVNPVLHLAYVLLEYYDERLKDAIRDCFWHSLDFFERCGCVYYRDLITQWILEGYFDPVRSVEKAYQDGHLILMELINRGMLKIQENNVVVPERAMSNLIDPRRDGLFKNSRLRFSQVYRGNKKKGLGKITQIDDMIKTVQAKKGDKMTTILVSGDRLRRVTPAKYFAKLKGLEVLGMFEPTLEPFLPDLLNGVGMKERLTTLDNLRVLVIRDCDLLNNIEGLKVLGQLQALEVSGASSLKEIPDDFFAAFLKLQSLHLSGLMIPSSPSSISLLKKLHCLIIKDCPLLKDLPDIQELTELEVVDVSGAHGLQTCFDNKSGEKKDKSKNKNFYHLTKLQLLDFSESQIERLPIFQDSAAPEKLHKVTRLLLRDCSKLRRLPSLKPLSGLQILDLSGTTSLVEMLEVCFEDKKELKSINFSRTSLSELATTIEELTGLTEFLLKDCTNIESIPNITPLENLEVFDVSGSTKLKTIDVSFEKMFYLREVNLSGTQVKTPELPAESKIHGTKRITLANGMSFEGKDWKEVKEQMPDEGSDEASSSAAVVDDEEISEKKPEDARSSAPVVTRENQPIQPRTRVSNERLLQVPVERALYKTSLDFFKVASQPEIMEINETNVVDDEALAKAEFVSFVDCSSTRITSIFNKTKLVKSCSLTMCTEIKDLFAAVVDPVHPAVDAERLELLETLSITNLPLLESISGGASLKNLKELSIECCPIIITLFPEASELPINLKELQPRVKYCEKLKKIAEGVDLSPSTNPQVGEISVVDSDWVVVDHSEISSQG